MGLNCLLYAVRRAGGNNNTGNCSRIFFPSVQTAAILKIDQDIIQKFHLLLCALSSSQMENKMAAEELERYAGVLYKWLTTKAP